MGDLVSYGGDLKIVAIRNEIQRVQQNLLAAGHTISSQLEFADFVSAPLSRIAVAMQWPTINEKLQQLLAACDSAAEQYFDGEALIAKEIMDVNIAPVIAGSIALVGGSLGLFHETDGLAREVKKPFRVSAPQSLADFTKRVQFLDDANQPRVQIEKYGNKFVVAIPGTQTWNPIALANPLDFTSNLGSMKSPNTAASERSVLDAMRKAGIGRGSQVLFVGHSQGGLIAANIAVTRPREFSVAGVITLGAPIAHLEQRLNVPTISLQHKNDLVPRLGVKANPLAENWVTVMREAPIKPDANALIEAHEISNYKKTAELADKSTDPGVSRIRDRIVNFIGINRGDEKIGWAKTFELLRR